MTSEHVEIEGSNVKGKTSMHESGVRMIVFSPFRPSDTSEDTIRSLIEKARHQLGPELEIIRVCIDSDQAQERMVLESMGFGLDGIEYGIPLNRLKEQLSAERSTLPASLQVSLMDYDQDIDAVVQLEQSVHAADLTSRVQFESEPAIEGMKVYYKNACGGQGVFILRREQEMVGLVGLMLDRDRADAVHISSVAISLEFQGQGLFFPLILTALQKSRFASAQMLTGVTTTSRLIEAARRYEVGVLGVSLSMKL
jgi:hypothetical protein